VGQPVVVASALDPLIGTTDLKRTIVETLEKIEMKRDRSSPFLMAVDHCFNIKGSGAVCTGTVLQGKVKVGDVRAFSERYICFLAINNPTLSIGK
jgi:selenocysteine-specific translation elongation factor